MFGKSTLTSLLVTLGVALVCAPVTVQAHPMSHVLRRQDGNDTSSGNTTQLKYTSPKLCDPDVKQVRGVVVLQDKQIQYILISSADVIVFRILGCCQ